MQFGRTTLLGKKLHCLKGQDTVRKFTDGASKVKLPGGIFGKTCYVLISVCGAFAAISWAARSPGVAYAALGLLGVIILFALWRMFRFADAHPEVAILEGAELLHLRQLELAQKGKGVLVVTESEASDTSGLVITGDTEQALQLPDPDLTEDAKPKRRRTNG